MRHTTLAATLALCTLASAGGLAAPTYAEVIRLRTGETLKGRLVEGRTNENVVVIEDLALGGVREFAWEVILPEDADLIRERVGIQGGVGKFMYVACDVIRYRLSGGTTEIRGLVEGEEGGYLLVRTAAQREPLRIEKASVIERDRDECEATAIWPPETLYEMRKTEDPPQSARDWFNLARLAERWGAYEAAKEAYENAALDDTFLGRTAAQQAIVRMTSLINDAQARETLRDLRNALQFQMFRKVRDGIEGFGAKHPEAADETKAMLERLKTDLVAVRLKHFSAEIGRRFVPLAKRLINARVRGKDVKLRDVQSWAAKELAPAVREDLLKTFVAIDPSVTAEEVAGAFWEGRPKRTSDWKLARYGSGTLIVYPPQVKPGSGGSRPAPSGKGGAPAAPFVPPKPPTPDQWWERNSTDVRTEWTFAYFVEKGGVFEVDPKPVRQACDKCLGEGTISKSATNGAAITYLCDRCGGTRSDVSVRYR